MLNYFLLASSQNNSAVKWYNHYQYQVKYGDEHHVHAYNSDQMVMHC